MDLFYTPMACSLSARVVCIEGNLDVTLRRVDLGDRDPDLVRVNPMSKVPTLICDDGAVLTENVAVLLYLGDRGGLVPPEGTAARYAVIRWLSFVATELHKHVLSTVFGAEPTPDLVRSFARDAAPRPLAVLDQHLRGRATLVGDTFTVADAYLVWALTLIPHPPCAIALDAYPAVHAYLERHRTRASVKTAVSIELRELRGAATPGDRTGDRARGA